MSGLVTTRLGGLLGWRYTKLLVAFTALGAVTSGAQAEPKFACDMTNPSPPKLCSENFGGYPGLIQNCIQQEVDALNFINNNSHALNDRIVEDCADAGCKAGYSKLKTTAACMKSMMSLKPKS